ncbi:hypothetical protein D9M72_304010 [compost metagenome]
MATVNRIIKDEYDRKMFIRFIEGRKLPFTVSLMDGKHRTNDQNRLQRLWMTEISAQLGDRTPEEARGYCKLTIGVPILREENDVFRRKYDSVVKPLTYEQKLTIMMEPLDLPVTRIMTTRQKTAYLDGIFRHFSEQGVVLTLPDALQKQGAAA